MREKKTSEGIRNVKEGSCVKKIQKLKKMEDAHIYSTLTAAAGAIIFVPLR